MGRSPQRARIEAPADWDTLDLAQVVVGPRFLLKAERVGKDPFSRHPAMQRLHAKVLRAYKAQLAWMMKVIRRYVEKQIVGNSLGKSDRLSRLFTAAQLEQIRKYIVDYHLAFAVGVLGHDIASTAEIQRLIDDGVLPAGLERTFRSEDPAVLPPEAMTMIDTAFVYGRVSANPEHVQTLSLPALERKPIELRPIERHALEGARQSAAIHIRGLGNKVADDFSTLAIEADADLRRRYHALVRDLVVSGIEKRETWRKVLSEIGHATGDWARDLGRIAATEKQRAMQDGIASELIQATGRDPKDIRVAKQPAPDACGDCNRLHLTAGAGSPPRIFKLSELITNGSNVGRKRAQWKPVVGTVHPWCACELVHVPDGWAFNDEGVMVPESMLSRADTFERDLRKAHLSYRNAPERGCTIRIGDPRVRAEVERVVAECPIEIFDNKVGVTLITTDIPRAETPLEDHDFAYWTANEIRLMQTLPVERVERVIRHELGHSLNIHLIHKFGGTDKVRAWHRKLWRVSKREGFVSDYAKREPIENAAEATRLYLFNRPRLMLRFPLTFAMLHNAYSDIWRHEDSDHS